MFRSLFKSILRRLPDDCVTIIFVLNMVARILVALIKMS